MVYNKMNYCGVKGYMKTSKFVSEAELNKQHLTAAELSCEIEPRGLRFFVETFGCQMNVRDSETIKGWLIEMGYSEAGCKE